MLTSRFVHGSSYLSRLFLCFSCVFLVLFLFLFKPPIKEKQGHRNHLDVNNTCRCQLVSMCSASSERIRTGSTSYYSQPLFFFFFFFSSLFLFFFHVYTAHFGCLSSAASSAAVCSVTAPFGLVLGSMSLAQPRADRQRGQDKRGEARKEYGMSILVALVGWRR